MRSDACWKLFLTTGSPEAYLMYNEAKRMEQTDVSQNQGACSAGDALQ